MPDTVTNNFSTPLLNVSISESDSDDDEFFDALEEQPTGLNFRRIDTVCDNTFISLTAGLRADLGVNQGLSFSASSSLNFRAVVIPNLRPDIPINGQGGDVVGNQRCISGELTNRQLFTVGRVEPRTVPDVRFSLPLREPIYDALDPALAIPNATSIEPEQHNASVVILTDESETLITTSTNTIVEYLETPNPDYQTSRTTNTQNQCPLDGLTNHTYLKETPFEANDSTNSTQNNTSTHGLNQQLPIETDSNIGALLPSIQFETGTGLRFSMTSDQNQGEESDIPHRMRLSAIAVVSLNIQIQQTIHRILQVLGARVADARPQEGVHFYLANQMMIEPSASFRKIRVYFWDSTPESPYRSINIASLLQAFQTIGQTIGYYFGRLVFAPVLGMSLGGMISTLSGILFLRCMPSSYLNPDRYYAQQGFLDFDSEFSVVNLSGMQNISFADSLHSNLRMGIITEQGRVNRMHQIHFSNQNNTQDQNGTTSSVNEASDSEVSDEEIDWVEEDF